MRIDSRKNWEMRPFNISLNDFEENYQGVTVTLGETKVICYAFKKPSEQSELTVTFQVLPFATKNRQEGKERKDWEKSLKKIFSSYEKAQTSLFLDCVVIKDRGSSQELSVAGGSVALSLLLQETTLLGSINCGLVQGEIFCDLSSEEEKKAEAMFQVVMDEKGNFVHLAASGDKFSGEELNLALHYSKAVLEDQIAKGKEIFIHDQQEVEEIVIATKNSGKAKEFQKMFSPLGLKVKTLLDFPEIPEVIESGRTFEENAILKAETIANLLKTTVLADDSGLMVDALEGQPGIFSARYAGPEKNDASNNAKLLANLAQVPKDKRQAQFYCALAVANPKKETLTVHGIWEGEIASIPKGEDGFGYDPLFFLPDLNKTAAELSREEKNRLSHRGKALEALKKSWPKWWSE